VATVRAVIAEMGSPTMKDMGAVMKNAKAKFGDAASTASYSAKRLEGTGTWQLAMADDYTSPVTEAVGLACASSGLNDSFL